MATRTSGAGVGVIVGVGVMVAVAVGEGVTVEVGSGVSLGVGVENSETGMVQAEVVSRIRIMFESAEPKPPSMPTASLITAPGLIYSSSILSVTRMPFFASSAWTAEDSLTLVVRLYETPFYYTCVFHFAGDELLVESRINASLEARKPLLLSARAQP